jgi:hypothetical protein
LTDDAGNTNTDHGDLPEFPSEHEWLGLTPPDETPGFVDRVTDALIREDLVTPDPQQEAAMPLCPDGGDDALLRHYDVPTPSPNFVDGVMARLARPDGRANDDDRWRELLLRYDTPAASAEFVEQTMQALRAHRREGRPAKASVLPVPRTWLGWSRWPLAAAAAVIVLFASWPTRPAASLRRLIAELPDEHAHSHSPSVLAHLLHDHEPPSHAMLDAYWLWSDERAR